VITIRGIEFFDWQPNELVEIEEECIYFSCVLLPLHTVNEGSTLYATIREDYTMLTGAGEFK